MNQESAALVQSCKGFQMSILKGLQQAEGISLHDTDGNAHVWPLRCEQLGLEASTSSMAGP